MWKENEQKRKIVKWAIDIFVESVYVHVLYTDLQVTSDDQNLWKNRE